MGTNLYVDDNRDPPKGWHVARNVEEAMIYMLLHEVDNLDLDHDLDAPHCPKCNFACGLREGGCRHGCRCHQDGRLTGFDLLKWIARKGAWPNNRPTVHSANTEMAPQMEAFIEANYPGA